MQGKMNPIYIVYVCTELVFIRGFTTVLKKPVKAKRLMRPGKDQPMGFFFEKDEAIRCVRANAGDMIESYFTYALVEEVYPGNNFLEAERRWGFKIDLKTRKYVDIQIPEYVTEDVILEPMWKE